MSTCTQPIEIRPCRPIDQIPPRQKETRRHPLWPSVARMSHRLGKRGIFRSRFFFQGGGADQYIRNVCFARDPCIGTLVVCKSSATIDQSKELQNDPRRAAATNAADKQTFRHVGLRGSGLQDRLHRSFHDHHAFDIAKATNHDIGLINDALDI